MNRFFHRVIHLRYRLSLNVTNRIITSSEKDSKPHSLKVVANPIRYGIRHSGSVELMRVVGLHYSDAVKFHGGKIYIFFVNIVCTDEMTTAGIGILVRWFYPSLMHYSFSSCSVRWKQVDSLWSSLSSRWLTYVAASFEAKLASHDRNAINTLSFMFQYRVC